MSKDNHTKKASDPSERPAKVRAETLPVEPGHAPGKPVEPARHAETHEQARRTEEMEKAKVPPPGSRDYVAGQPVNEKERSETEAEADRLAKAGKAQRSEAEQAIAENDPHSPEHRVKKGSR